MSTPIEPGAACPCGQSLPWHLLELGVGLKHICSCERTVVPTADGGFEIPDERTPNLGGFKAEIEFGGRVFEYEYAKPLDHKEWVTVAVVTLKDGAFTIEHRLPTGSAVVEKWGLTTGQAVPVDMVVLSPNHWGPPEQRRGNRHHIFVRSHGPGKHPIQTRRYERGRCQEPGKGNRRA